MEPWGGIEPPSAAYQAAVCALHTASAWSDRRESNPLILGWKPRAFPSGPGRMVACVRIELTVTLRAGRVTACCITFDASTPNGAADGARTRAPALATLGATRYTTAARTSLDSRLSKSNGHPLWVAVARRRTALQLTAPDLQWRGTEDSNPDCKALETRRLPLS